MKGNAKIKSTFLGYEHGMLTCSITLEQEDSCQSFGGYRLDEPNNVPSIYCGEWIHRLLKVAGVECWENLVGQYVRVEGEDMGKIEGLGHIIENIWFFPKDII